MMLVFGPQLVDAAAEMRERGLQVGRLREPVAVTPEQLETAGRILSDGPQPIANGITADMPGFIDAEQQEHPGVLVFTVGILPSTTYRIDRSGEVLTTPARVSQPSPEEAL